MKESVRRIIMFCTILTVGMILIFFDITFIQLLVIIVAIAIILPFILGLVTIAEIRTTIGSFKERRLKKVGFLKKLDDIRFFEGKTPKKVPAKPAAKPEPVIAKPAAPKGTPQKIPFAAPFRSLFTSLRSFGSAIKKRGKPKREVAEINKLLDGAVSEKVVAPAAAVAGAAAAESSLPAPGGGAGTAQEAEPFLSLSEDEFDTSLLEGLDMEGEPAAASITPEVPEGSAETGLPEPELSMPSLDIESAAGDILKESGGEEGLDEFSGLETGGLSESEFGDLDNLSLEDVDLDVDLEEEEGEKSTAAPAEVPETTAAPAAPAAPVKESPAVKTTWIPSDAPKDADLMQDEIGIQSDMASFASASGGTDEDLLSSIASDVKLKTKERDLSLLRELKDFKAPADEIEKELTDMYQRISSAKKPKEKTEPTQEK